LLNNLLNTLNPAVLTADAADVFPRVMGLDANMVYDSIFTAINVIVIVLVLSWLLYKPVRKFLNDRKERIAADLAEAATNKADAEEKRTLYEGKLIAISSERDDILESARKAAGERETEIINGANSEAAVIIERAKLEIEREREKARDEMRTQIVQVSALMAEKLLGGGMDEGTKDKILNEAIAELGDAVWSK